MLKSLVRSKILYREEKKVRIAEVRGDTALLGRDPGIGNDKRAYGDPLTCLPGLVQPSHFTSVFEDLALRQ